MICNECRSEDSKYKFKCCLNSFCSLNCYKSHQCSPNATLGGNINSTNFIDKKENSSSTTDANNMEKELEKEENYSTTKDANNNLENEEITIKQLRKDEMLRKYLSRKSLRQMLLAVSSSQNPLEAARSFLGVKEFSDFFHYLLSNYSC